MIDPNTNVTLFESGAIVQYLIAQYDNKHLLSYPEDNLQEKWATNSWLMVQMSGQGPMFGQKMWFTYFHQKRNVETAISRYGEQNEELKPEQNYPEWFKWHQEMVARPAVAEALEERAHAMETMEDTAAAVLPQRED
ncbi:hypothetical protein IL306_002896 [Fusarium sp. DS 682]|nr:hypothetical protein IL306_002896 [Fusarium sp. DS 682]